MCKQSDRAPSGTPSPRRSVGGGGGLMDESSLANSTIQRRSTREDCAGRLDGWTKTTKNRCTTVHDSSMEVSGAGSRGDRPTASTARSRRPTASTARPPSTALDRPRASRVDDGLDRGRAVRDGRTDRRTDGRTERNGPTERPTERTERSLARVRSRVSSTAACARERERFEIRAAVIRAFIHSFIHFIRRAVTSERARVRGDRHGRRS